MIPGGKCWIHERRLPLTQWHPNYLSCGGYRAAEHTGVELRVKLLERQRLGKHILAVAIPGPIDGMLTLDNMAKQAVVRDVPA